MCPGSHVILGQQRPPEVSADAQHAEVAPGHHLAHQHVHPVSHVSLGDDDLMPLELGQHARGLLLELQVVGVVQPVEPPLALVAVDVDQRLRRLIRPVPKQYGIHHAEDRGVRPDPHGERDQGDGREPGILVQHAQREANVL